MPKLGLTMETGAVGAWLVAEGDEVKAGQVIAEIVTEKITYELEAETAGVMLKILLAEEEEVPVGTPIAVIGQPGEAA
jgi:pyruvate/2-oxoglutarate dehydrogenase complex dihydrolipoamide acyltransferase (E2) component